MYEFISKKQEKDRILFLLTLNKEKMTERIIIGKAEAIRQRLKKDIGDVLYDETRPLGTLLLDFESDPDKEWRLNASYIADNFARLLTKNIDMKSLKPYADFLQRKYESGEPTAMFAAVQTWEEYLRLFGEKGGSDEFLARVVKLYKPFSKFSQNNHELWQLSTVHVAFSTLYDDESKAEVWYPMKKFPFECIVVSKSFLPIIFYYLNRLNEWKLILQKCKVCQNGFLTTNKRSLICSDKCRKVTAVRAKQRYDRRNKGDKIEMTYENSYQYWYNRLRKLKRNNAPDEEIAVFTEAFDNFKKAAIKQKTKAKNGVLKFKDFNSWLIEQQKIVDSLVKHGRG